MGSNLISVQLKELPGALDRGDKRLRAAVAFGARAGAERGRAVMVKRTPRDQGQMAGSWKVHPGHGGDLLAELINDAPHVVFVEIGSRPHKVSAEGWAAIYEWVRRHFRSGQLGGSGRMRSRRRVAKPLGPFRGDDPEVARITWGIVRKLEKFGQKPTFFVLDSLPELREVMASELARALENESRRGRG